jgi:inhibitor of KinA sporulation pathway (predicted exonuclease)
MTTLTELLGERELLIIDFEATCWDRGDAKPNAPVDCDYASEIIEFGVVRFSPSDARILDEFQSFVRPVHHPCLTRFCSELTSIGQLDVDEADPFPDVLARFKDRFALLGDETDPRFTSWGAYDRKQLMDDCLKHGARYPFERRNHLNLKQLATEVLSLPRNRRGTAKAFAYLGLEFQGTAHRAIDDARNYAFLLQYLLSNFGDRMVVFGTTDRNDASSTQ